MLGALVLRGRIRFPAGFGLWFGFLVWMLGSGIELDSSARVLGWAYRASLYLSATAPHDLLRADGLLGLRGDRRLPRAGLPARLLRHPGGALHAPEPAGQRLRAGDGAPGVRADRRRQPGRGAAAAGALHLHQRVGRELRPAGADGADRDVADAVGRRAD